MNRDRDVLGYVETTYEIGARMAALRRNQGTALDPAAGMSLFRNWFSEIVGCEISPERVGPGVINCDFFSLPVSQKFDTIICNPPYVRGNRIVPETRALFGASLIPYGGDLYLHFIEKAVEHLPTGGELIFVNPRGFAKDTSARKLNCWLATQGAMTHWYELGDRAFPDASPDCCIWRWVKGAKQSVVETNQGFRIFSLRDGAVFLSRGAYPRALSEFAKVRVGAVSGADYVFEKDVEGALDFVFSETERTGATRKMLYPTGRTAPVELLPHRADLLARRVRTFDDTNWWRWGRECADTRSPRVYVNCKTRSPRPFFEHPCTRYDGAILGVFPHRRDTNLTALAAALNAVDWADLGFVSSGRLIFTQRSLENAPLPVDFLS